MLVHDLEAHGAAAEKAGPDVPIVILVGSAATAVHGLAAEWALTALVHNAEAVRTTTTLADGNLAALAAFRVVRASEIADVHVAARGGQQEKKESRVVFVCACVSVCGKGWMGGWVRGAGGGAENF